MTLAEILAGLAASGVLGALAVPFLTWLEGKWPWLAQAEGWVRRATAWLVTAALAIGVHLFQVGMLYEPAPASGREWIERLLPLAWAAITANQGLHIITKKKEPK